MDWWHDLEDFTAEEMRLELRRREVAAEAGRCWYCGAGLDRHTCKHAVGATVPPGRGEVAGEGRDE